jgi:hypothetical protein
MRAWLAEVLMIKDSVEFLKWNEEKVLPYKLRNNFILHDVIMWMKKVIKVSSFTRVLNGFQNYGRKVHTTFRGSEMWDQLKKTIKKNTSPYFR